MFGSQAQSMVKKYTQLRYRMLPFRYSNALTAYVVKPTVYPVRWIGSTQLLVGQGSSQILVQPVTTAGATTASVALAMVPWGMADLALLRRGQAIALEVTPRWAPFVRAAALTLAAANWAYLILAGR